MNKKIHKPKVLKLILIICLAAFLIYFLLNNNSFFRNSADTFLVENGTLSYEESAQGYIIRDESVLKGNNYSSGLSQIVTDGTRVSKGESVFRYYSNNEETINNQISDLDKQIDEALQSNKQTNSSPDIMNIEKEIKSILDNVYQETDLQIIAEYQKKLNTYIVKKAEIAGELSPAGSYIKTLIEQRKNLSNQLTSDSEIVTAPNAGIISYRVDGLEEALNPKNEDFSYLGKDLLESFNLNIGMSIPESKESGKIVNNFGCYIACYMETENAEVGDKLTIRLSDSSEIPAEIVYIKDDGNGKIIVLKIKESVEKLLEYRKISFEIIWWSFSGWKVSNSSLILEDDLTYVKRTKAGIEEKILVKILRQNDTYSIVENYSDEELNELGYTLDEIQSYPKIKLYDQIMVNKNQ